MSRPCPSDESRLAPDFIIVASQRTGSNMLVSAFREHPQIECFGELFRQTPDWMRKKGYRGALKMLDHVDPKFRDDAYRMAHPTEYLRLVFAATPDGALIGYKHMVSQNVAYLKKLAADQSCKKILLYRDNLLAAYSSELIARKTGQGNAWDKAAVKRATVRFDADECKRFRGQRERQYGEVRHVLERSGSPYTEVEYNSLRDPGQLQRLLAFLGVDESVEIQPQTVKRNPSDILKRFDNPGDVERFLEKIGRPDWAREGGEQDSDG